MKKLDLRQKIRAVNKFGQKNRLMMADMNIESEPPALQNFIRKDKIMKNCVPINMEKIEARAELGYYRLICVNNNIETLDYGQAVYDDIPTLKRNKINIID